MAFSETFINLTTNPQLVNAVSDTTKDDLAYLKLIGADYCRFLFTGTNAAPVITDASKFFIYNSSDRMLTIPMATFLWVWLEQNQTILSTPTRLFAQWA